MNLLYVIISAVLIFVLVRLYYLEHRISTMTTEHLTTQQTNEAIQNIASLYNTGNFTVSNLTVTNNASIGGTLTTAGTLTAANGATVKNGLNVDTANITNLTATNQIAAPNGIDIASPDKLWFSNPGTISRVPGYAGTFYGGYSSGNIADFIAQTACNSNAHC